MAETKPEISERMRELFRRDVSARLDFFRCDCPVIECTHYLHLREQRIALFDAIADLEARAAEREAARG